MSRSVARRLVEDGEALFDGVELEPKERVAAGTLVDTSLPEPFTLAAEPVPFDVVYEEADFALIDKPAGLVVHPGSGIQTGTLAAGIIHRWPDVEGVGEAGRWGIVHRLDKETSGLLAVAKTSKGFDWLRREMKAGAIGRTYLALVEGTLSIETGAIDAPIGRDEQNPVRFRVAAGGRPAVTHYRRLAGWEDVSLLEVQLKTGRTHQIRVHLSSIHYPVVGDGLYGARSPVGDPGRVWLHAVRLKLPREPKELVVESVLPPDLVRSLDGLGAPTLGAVPKSGNRHTGEN